MAITKIDSTELEYLKVCRDKLRDITAVLNIKGRQEEKQDKKETSPEEKLKEIEKIIKS
ncbi:MAG: hypothetical protein Q8N42_02315 [bacterium]|nr:hypothetical protein [bacterium]